MDQLRVLELYSGIGGMHYALKGSSSALVLLTALVLFSSWLTHAGAESPPIKMRIW